MATNPVPGLGEMVAVVQSWQRENGGPLILRMAPDAWRAAYDGGALGRGPDMWPAPPGSGQSRRVSVVVGQGQRPGSWQLLDAGEVIASGYLAT